MSNKAADNMSSGVEQPTIDLSPDMPNDPAVQSNKDLALNEKPNGVGVESKCESFGMDLSQPVKDDS
nr:hypothetical protein [Tanacetum cinerariifolium]